MNALQKIIKQISELPVDDKKQLIDYLEDNLTLDEYSSQIDREVSESRFSKGKVCPFCGHAEIVKNGIYHGKNSDKQRYKCLNIECHKSFTDYTLSPVYNSKKTIKHWLLYAKCMIKGYSIRKCAKIVEINIVTSFYWRHKLLDALRVYIRIGSLGGVIELDEAFFPESFKGNHKNSKTFAMPRQSHKRGKSVKVRGISREQVCVVCGQDRLGKLATELICKGRIKHSDLTILFQNRIDYDSIICTDSHKSYIKFAQNLNLEHHQIKRGKHLNGVYHIQHINVFHSRLKKFMLRFNGIATKYLCNYLYWAKWLQLFDDDKDIVKGKNLMVQASTAITKILIKDFKTREAIFI